jgi:tRNA(adenine34) deaminase
MTLACHELTMAEAPPTEPDFMLMDEVLREAHAALAEGGAGVAAALAGSDGMIAMARNKIQETGDFTRHAEMVLLQQVGRKLQIMDDESRRGLSLYVTLEPCLMCAAALSFTGIKRIVYAALAEDANMEQMIVRGLTLPKINQRLVRGPFTLVPGVRREEGRELLRRMGKAAGAPADLQK